MQKELVFKRLQVIHEYCKMREDLNDFVTVMEEIMPKAKAYHEKGNNKKLLEYNNYFVEIIEDDPNADLFLMKKIGISVTTKKIRHKIFNELIKSKEIMNYYQYYLIKEKIYENYVKNKFKLKYKIYIIKELNILFLK